MKRALQAVAATPWTLAVVALSIGATALFLWGPPGSAGPLLADRAALAGGQLWRLATGPLVHWNLGHLAWDGSILLVLGLVYERRVPRVWPVALVAGLLVPAAAVFASYPRLGVYYGTSGATHALMATALAYELARDHRRWSVRLLAAGFIAKIAWGLFGPGPLVGPELAESMRETPIAHLAGPLVGLLAWVMQPRTATFN